MKKIVTIFLLVCLAFLNISVSAAPTYSDNVAPILSELNIMKGDPDGNLRLDDFVSRAECTKIAVAASSFRDMVAVGSKTSPFRDVPASHWAAPYVTVAVKNGICKGYIDATFKPGNTVLYEEALTMFLRVLGYSEADFGSSWPDGQIGIAKNIGLCDKLSKQRGDVLTRRDVMTIVYNLLNTPAKNSSVDYLSSFERTIVDDVLLIATSKEDSSVGAGKVATSSGTYKITENFNYDDIGKRGSISLRNNDTVVAFMPNAQTAETYDVTGIIGSDIMFGNNILDVDEDTPVYYKSDLYTYSSVAGKIKAGDVCKLVRNDKGEIDYILFTTSATSSSLTDIELRTCVISDVIGDKVLGMIDNVFSEVTLSPSAAYYDGDELSSYNAISSKLQSGDTLTMRYDKNGDLTYIIYNRNSSNTNIHATNLVRHVVYSSLGNGIITYKDGVFDKIEFSGNTLFYEDDSQTSSNAIMSKISLGDVLHVKYKENGLVEYVVYEEGTNIGPKTVTSSNWYSDFGVTVENTTIMRDGVKATASDIKINDIVYYSSDLNMFLAYSKKITGVYENAIPNNDTPSSVVISGVTYEIEGVDAFQKLSSSGMYRYGDIVTLLIGKTGAVAGVADNKASSSNITGFLSAVGTKNTIVSGSNVVKPYIKIVLPDGEVCEYITEKDYKSYVNKVVTVKFTDGVASISSVAQNDKVSGMFAWDSGAGLIGSYTLASNVKIIEVSTTESDETSTVASVYPQRLNGIRLSASDVLYSSKNSLGNIDELIIRDVTGDMHTYGVVTYAKTNSNEMMLSGSYRYMVNGTETTLSTQNKTYSISSGQAVKIKSNGHEVTSILPLYRINSTKITNISGSVITLNDTGYIMSDKVQIYLKESYGDIYKMITLDELGEIADKYTAYVYTDKETSSGGRVRIIILRGN